MAAALTLDDFLKALLAGMSQHAQARCVLSKPARGAPPTLQRWTLAPVRIQGQRLWQRVARHRTQDLTDNWPADQALREVKAALGTQFLQANAQWPGVQWQVRLSAKGQVTVSRQTTVTPTDPEPETPDDGALNHDRAKHRWIDPGRPFLQALGVTDASGQIVPSMSRKWKQINKFVEVLDGALRRSGLLPTAAGRPIDVLDFGSGKGYLTFALHDHLRQHGAQARVTGVELRGDMVALCNDAAQRVGAEGLHMVQGDVATHAPQRIDVMVALHACDVATDHALHHGLRAGARVIVCSPCCHKELRPQLLSPHPLRPLLQFGIHKGQTAEMLTDGLRALWLSAWGYDTQVFEFVALEHTAKNKMILAVRSGEPVAEPDPKVLAQIEALKAFYGVSTHTLETLLSTHSPFRKD